MRNGIVNLPASKSPEDSPGQTIVSDVPSLSEAQFPSRFPRLAFSVQETADLLGISEKSVRRLVARRLLNPSRALRHLLFSRKEVERFLDETISG